MSLVVVVLFDEIRLDGSCVERVVETLFEF